MKRLIHLVGLGEGGVDWCGGQGAGEGDGTWFGLRARESWMDECKRKEKNGEQDKTAVRRHGDDRSAFRRQMRPFVTNRKVAGIVQSERKGRWETICREASVRLFATIKA